MAKQNFVVKIGRKGKVEDKLKETVMYIGDKTKAVDFINEYYAKMYIRYKDEQEVWVKLNEDEWKSFDELVKKGRFILK